MNKIKTYMKNIMKKSSSRQLKELKSLSRTHVVVFLTSLFVMAYPSYVLVKTFFYGFPIAFVNPVLLCISIVSIVYLSYLNGIIYPIMKRAYYLNSISYNDMKKFVITCCLKTGIIGSLAVPCLIAISVPLIKIMPLSIQSYMGEFIVGFGMLPALLTYQFVYKPARAGRLPKWLYRWLERKNPRLALPFALSDDASVDNAEYTIVDDAPECADA